MGKPSSTTNETAIAGHKSNGQKTDSEQSFRSLAENSPDIITRHGIDFRYLYANARIENVTGLKAEEFIGKTYRELCMPESLCVFFDTQLAHVFATKAAHEVTFAMPDGKRHIQSRLVPEFDSSGTVVSVLVLSTDITALKETENKLRESEERYATVINASDLGVWDFDVQKQELVGAGKMADIYGLASNHDCNLIQVFESIHPDDRHKQEALYANILAGKVTTSFTNSHRIVQKVSGAVCWIKATARAFFTEEGMLYRIVGTVADITDQHQAEQALAYQKQLLETVTENTDMALFLMDDQQYCVYMNEAAEKMTGFTLDELKGKQLHYHIHHTYPDGSHFPLEDCPIDQALPSQKRMKGEEVFVHKDGSFYSVAFTASPIMVEGKAVGTVIEVRQTTEEKKKEGALRESEAKFRHLIQSNIIGVLFWDLNGGILDANDELLAMLGYTKADLDQGLDWQSITPEEWRKADAEGVRQIQETGRHKPFEKQYLHKDGHPVDVIIGSSAFDHSGNRQGVTFVLDITTRKKAEQAIRDSEARFRTLANDTPAFLFTADGETNVDFVNRRWLQFVGLTDKEGFGKSWEDVTHPDDIAPMYAIYLDAVHHKKPYQFEIRQKNAAGEYHWVLWNGIPRTNEQGELAGIVGIGIDITEQKLVEGKIKESENRYRRLFDSSPIAITEEDHSPFYEKMESLSAAGITDYAAYFAAHPEELYEMLGKVQILGVNAGLLDLTGSKDLDHFVANRSKFFVNMTERTVFNLMDLMRNGGGYFNEETIIKSLSGELKEVILRLKYPTVQPYSSIAITMLDVTEQKRFEEKIKESEKHFRTLADSMPQIVWTSRSDGYLDYYNKRWYEFTGFEEGYGDQSWIPILHPDDVQLCIDTWYHSVQSGEPYQIEYRFKDKLTGSYKWFLGKALPVRDAEGSITKWFGSCTDIDHQKRFSEKLEVLVTERTRELQRSNEDLQQFAHVASHDLKEPVRKIRTFGSRLQEEFKIILPDKAQTYLSKIELSADRMYQMIDGVLLYSSLSTTEQLNVPVDLKKVIQNIETDLEMLIAQKSAVIEYGNLPQIEGAPVLLHQLFYNLIYNSLKFAKEGVAPVIRLTWEIVKGTKSSDVFELELDFVRISVQDNGIGFNHSEGERIFQTFTRLHSKDKFEGTGLGLTLCRKIVERHGGTIHAESSEGEGALFIITLPLKTQI